MNIADKLIQAADGMTQAERACFKILLASAVAEVAESIPSGRLTERDCQREPLRTLLSTTARLQPHRDRVPASGYMYRGRPDWVTNDLLSRLQFESESLRDSAARFHEHLVVSGAPFARETATSRSMTNLIERYCGPIEPTAKANYIYYDQVGMGIEPHLDTEDFSLNVIMMLSHSPTKNPSALVLFPPDLVPRRIDLVPGEMVAIYADSVIHAREYMTEGEHVSIVAFGFTPINSNAQ